MSLNNVTVTLKRQEKNVNIFFLKQDTFLYKKMYVDTFTKKGTRNNTAAYTTTNESQEVSPSPAGDYKAHKQTCTKE